MFKDWLCEERQHHHIPALPDDILALSTSLTTQSCRRLAPPSHALKFMLCAQFLPDRDLPACAKTAACLTSTSLILIMDSLDCRYTHFVSKLPASRQAFDEQLRQFYSEHNAILSPPSIKGNILDCYTIFSAVAQKGGYEAVSDIRSGNLLSPSRTLVIAVNQIAT